MHTHPLSTCTYEYINKRTHTQTHTHTLLQFNPLSPITNIDIYTYIHTRKNTQTHTHTHTYT